MRTTHEWDRILSEVEDDDSLQGGDDIVSVAANAVRIIERIATSIPHVPNDLSNAHEKALRSGHRGISQCSVPKIPNRTETKRGSCAQK